MKRITTRRWATLAWLGVCTWLSGGTAWAADPSAPAVTGPTLVRFKASLFNRNTGELSSDVLAAGKAARPELLNVIGGEYAADSVLVSLEIRAPSGDIIPAGTRVRLRAVDTDALPFAAGKRAPRPRVLFDRVLPLGRVAVGGRTFVAFWLPSAGCAPVSLSAEIIATGPAAKLTDSIGFVCHE